MRLGLSSDAARGASAEDLVAVCRRRGLSALEITHRNGPPAEHIAPLLAGASDLVIAGILHEGPAADAIVHAAAGARRLDAPVIVGGDAGADERRQIAREIIRDGGSAHVLVRGPATAWLDPVLDSGVPFAWQIDETCIDAAADAELILERTGRIDYVRLVGGGPESALQEGRGVGGLMRQLALAGCTAPLILVPSSQRYRLAWSAWLGRRGGWGCGSAADHRTHAPIPLVT